jgi:hypothetical protein
MKIIKVIALFGFYFFLTLKVAAQVTSPPTPDSKNCVTYKIEDNLCEAIQVSIQNAFNKAVSDSSVSFEESLTDEFENNILKDPDVLNNLVFKSSYVTSRIGKIPFKIKAKMIDRENADSVIGLEFQYEKNLMKTFISEKGELNHYLNIDFKIDGTVTRYAEENPRNFIEAKLTLAGNSYSNLPRQSLETIEILNSNSPDCFNSQTCMDGIFNIYDNGLEALNGFAYIIYGLEGGLETDQSFDAKNKTIGGFFFASYEAWDTDSWLGRTGIRPALRLSLDQVEPNDKTLRAMAGDNSQFSRWTGELSVNFPIGGFLGQAYNFEFNYRTYQEISPSEIIELSGLSNYHLRTFSISTPDNIYISYSSGRLPFDQRSQELVELGWNYNF